MAVLLVSVSHTMGGGGPLKLVPPTSAFISGTPSIRRGTKRGVKRGIRRGIRKGA